jgi:sirohydrochlorin cobaltochelatase
LAVAHPKYSDSALVLIGHGTTLDPDSATPVYQHGAELRRQGIFAEVHEAFWKQDPAILDVLNGISAPRIFLAPLFMSQGYFCEKVLPRTLGFDASDSPGWPRTMQRGEQRRFYCEPVGTHPDIIAVVLARARDIVRQFPFPRPPQSAVISLILAGHGTERDENSRIAVERQAEAVRALNLYSDVIALFLEEEPRISSWPKLTKARNVVVVPFFLGDGLHVKQDIPVLLGEPARAVRERLKLGQSPWRNPTEKRGRLIWYSPSIGTHPEMTRIILARVSEAAGWQ